MQPTKYSRQITVDTEPHAASSNQQLASSARSLREDLAVGLPAEDLRGDVVGRADPGAHQLGAAVEAPGHAEVDELQVDVGPEGLLYVPFFLYMALYFSYMHDM